MGRAARDAPADFQGFSNAVFALPPEEVQFADSR
jgi:hypothetical protein